jgi:hypothetical protein
MKINAGFIGAASFLKPVGDRACRREDECVGRRRGSKAMRYLWTSAATEGVETIVGGEEFLVILSERVGCARAVGVVARHGAATE